MFFMTLVFFDKIFVKKKKNGPKKTVFTTLVLLNLKYLIYDEYYIL